MVVGNQFCWFHLLDESSPAALLSTSSRSRALPPQRNTQMEEQKSSLLLIYFLSEVILCQWLSLKSVDCSLFMFDDKCSASTARLDLQVVYAWTSSCHSVSFIFYAYHLALSKRINIHRGYRPLGHLCKMLPILLWAPSHSVRECVPARLLHCQLINHRGSRLEGWP